MTRKRYVAKALRGDRIVPLDWANARYFAHLVSKEDRSDLYGSGGDARVSLEEAVRIASAGEGESWVWQRDGIPRAAFGWTQAGAIWSLCADLATEEKQALAGTAPAFIRAMVKDAGRSLGNLVWENNRRILAWLRATHCFHFEVDNKVRVGERFYIPFHTRPLGELLNV